MRTKSKDSRQTVINVTRILLVLLCFTVVFAVALQSVGVENIAFAGSYDTSEPNNDDGDQQYGTARPILGDNGELNATHFNYTGTGDNSTSPDSSTLTYTKTETFNNLTVTKDTLQAKKTEGKTSLDVWVGDNDFWGLRVMDTVKAARVVMVMNYTVSPFLQTLLTRDDVNVSVTVSYTATKTSGTNAQYCGVVPGNSLMNAITACELVDANESSYKVTSASTNLKKWVSIVSASNYSSTSHFSSNKPADAGSATSWADYIAMLNKNGKNVYLNSREGGTDYGYYQIYSNISFISGMGYGLGIGGDRYLEFKDLKFAFKITMDNTKLIEDDRTVIPDSSAPVVTSQYSTTTKDTYNPSPIYTANTSVGWDVWYEAISSKLSKYTDSIEYGAGKFISFTNSSLGEKSGSPYYKYSSITYSDTFGYMGNPFTEATLKKAYNEGGISAVETMLKYSGIGGKRPKLKTSGSFNVDDPFSSITWEGDAVNERFFAGIKNVKVGETEYEVGSLVNNGTREGQFYSADSDEPVGVAKITKINRTQVKVEIFMYTNAVITTTVTDYGGQSKSTRLEFGGIDPNIPSIGAEGEGTYSGISFDSANAYIKSDGSKLSWYRKKELVGNDYAGTEITIHEEDSNEYSPYLWFYSVDKADSLAGLSSYTAKKYSSYDDIKTAGLLPIAYESIGQFNYNFETGYARSINDKYDAYGGATGAGYYRFTFYTVDMAGNMATDVMSFYMKVDYETPSYSLKYFSGESTEILPSENGKWSTDKVRIELTFHLAYSGNSLVLSTEGGDNTYMFVLDGAGEPKSAGDLGYFVKYSNGDQVTDNNLADKRNLNDYVINTAFADGASTYADINVRWLDDSMSDVVVTFTFDNENETIAFLSDFTLYTGQYDKLSAPDEDDMMTSCRSTEWRSGVKVYLDRVAPEMAEYVDDGEDVYINELTQFVIPTSPSSRNWYTDSYEYGMLLDFSDSILLTDYANGLTVYTGVKNIINNEQFAAFQELDIANNYKNITSSAGYFDILNKMTVGESGVAIENGSTPINFNFAAALGAGMRVFYVWVVDQAGNISPVKAYYMLFDTTTYVIRTELLANSNLGNTASISHTNIDDDNVTKFKRGEEVKITLSLTESEDGVISYVPYKLSLINGRDESAVVTPLLENYTVDQTWNLANDDYAGYVSYAGYQEVVYIHDTMNSLAALDTETRIQFTHRQVIRPTYTNTELQYNAAPIKLPIVLDNEKARDSINVVYVSEDNQVLYVDSVGNATTNVNDAVLDSQNNPTLFVPTVVGTYNVRVYIDKSDDSFVIDTFDMDADGNQLYAMMQIEIMKGNVVVSAVPSQSVYGEEIVLGYTVSGIEIDRLVDEHISISVALDVEEFSPITNYNVGEYAIVGEILTLEDCNYNVVFESATHTIVQKDITISTWASSKTYGDVDTPYLFAIAKDVDFEETLAMLTNYGYVSVIDESEYALFMADNRITRVGGENVGAYDYIVNINLFDIDGNYNIVVDNSSQFVITQRTIVVDASGQSKVLPYGSTIDTTAILPTYRLSSNDAHLADEVALLVDGNISLATEGVEGAAPSGYSQMFTHKVELATSGNRNINLVLDPYSDYIIYIAQQDALVIRALPTDAFTFVYGVQEGDVNTRLVFNTANFLVEDGNTIPVDYDSITWVLRVNDSGIFNVGRYTVNASEVVVSRGGTPLTDVNVIVEDFNIEVVPVQIVVSPTYNTLEKTYGDAESVFGIGFEISQLNGSAFASGDTYAGMSYEQVYNEIQGEFARARYKTNGTLIEIGARYDSATDSNGNVLALNGSTVDSTTDYYGFAVARAFSIANNNFSLITSFSASDRFIINQKQIALDTSKIVGVSRAYNGTTEVYYQSGSAYDLSSVLARMQDDLSLAYVANYAVTGSATSEVATTITFENISLAGSSAHNYQLVSISNGGSVAGAVLNLDGSAVDSANFEDGVISVVISKLDNSQVGDDSNLVKITIAKIAVYKTDVVVTKQYDGSKSLSISDVSIINTPGTAVLYQIAEQGGLQLVYSGTAPQFSGVNVGENYSFNSLSIFFPLQNAGSVINQTNITTGNDITISLDEKGITMTVVNLGASITKRIINAQSFVSIGAVDRDYNSTNKVDTVYELTQDALASGDSASSLGLVLEGIADGVNVGTHNVSLSSASGISNDNYALDVESINKEYKLKVNIAKAKLLPNVVFEDRAYDTTTDVVYTVGNGSLALTTLNYSANLASELSQFMLSGNITYVLSANGVADPNVKGSEANGYAHNVLVSGLIITGDTTLLSNYELYGQRYVDGSYVALGEIVSGALIEDYELIDIVNITRVYLPIILNNVTIADKMYDGSNTATIDIKLEEGVVPAVDAPFIKISAEGHFERSAAGNNLAVTLDSLFVDIINDGNVAILNNYEIDNELDVLLTGNILRIPMAINVGEAITTSTYPVANIDIGAQYYNGNAKVDSKYFTKSVVGVLPEDEGVYDVIMGDGAYYFNSDVEVERDAHGNVVYYKDKECTPENVLTLIDGEYYDSANQVVTQKYAKILDKPATIYNLKLLSNKGVYLNYMLTYPSLDNNGNYVAYLDNNGVMHYYEKSDDAVMYYYPLDNVSRYVESLDNVDASDVVGPYVENGKNVYLIKEGANVSGAQSLGRLISYFQTTGRINQKVVSINEGGIEAIIAQHFNKEYDGTTKFYGVKDVDFREKGNSIIGVVSIDEDVEIADIFAEFSTAEIGECSVIFKASGIKGEHAYRYTISSTAKVQTKIDAKILPRGINTFLADGTMLYGARVDRIDGDVSYGFGTFEDHVKADLIDGGLYVNYKEYLVYLGFIDSVDDSIAPEDEAYLVKLLETKYTYDTITKSYGVAEDGEYIRLANNVDAPEVYAQFNNVLTHASAGSIADLYTIRGGKAGNFTFVATHKDGTYTARLEVLKRDLYVYVDGSSFTSVYAEDSFPSADEYLEFSGCEIAGETPKVVFQDVVTPKTRLAIYDPATSKLVAVNKYAKISDDEAMLGKYYVYEVYIPQGANYSLLNYNVVIANVTHNVDGDDTTPIYTCDGIEMGNASLLTIVLPTIKQSDITVKVPEIGDAHSFVYTVNEQGIGINRLYDVLAGYREDDIITFENNRVAVNAGEYLGKIKVTRNIKVDAKDANGYSVSWLSDSEVKINISKATLSATAGAHKVEYNGSSFTYDVSANSDYFYVSGANVAQNKISVKVEVLNDKGVKKEYTDPIIDAGIYYITISIKGLDNFNDWSKTTTLTVQRAKAYVTMDKTGFDVSQDEQGGIVVEKLTSIFNANSTYELPFSVRMGDENMPSEVSLNASDLQFILDNGTLPIKKAGRYTFKVVMKEGGKKISNYNIIGGSGILELLADNLANEIGSVIVEEGVLADELQVRDIVTNPLASDGAYLNAIEQFMPSLSKQAGLKDVARVAAVYRIGLYRNGHEIDASGKTVSVTVNVPENLDKGLSGIAIYMIGEDGVMTKLNYQLNEGVISYNTDYLGTLVFVDINPQPIEPWIWYASIGGAGLLGLIVVGFILVFAVRKAKLKKLD